MAFRAAWRTDKPRDGNRSVQVLTDWERGRRRVQNGGTECGSKCFSKHKIEKDQETERHLRATEIKKWKEQGRKEDNTKVQS